MIVPAAFVLPVWLLLRATIGINLVLHLPPVLDFIVRCIIAVLFTFGGSYMFRAWHGFEEVRAGLIGKVLAGCVFVLLALQILGVINLIPG